MAWKTKVNAYRITSEHKDLNNQVGYPLDTNGDFILFRFIGDNRVSWIDSRDVTLEVMKDLPEYKLPFWYWLRL